MAGVADRAVCGWSLQHEDDVCTLLPFVRAGWGHQAGFRENCCNDIIHYNTIIQYGTVSANTTLLTRFDQMKKYNM